MLLEKRYILSICLVFLLSPSSSFASVTNGSESGVWIKVESSSDVRYLEHDAADYKTQDGICVEGTVYKSPDGVDLIVNKDHTVSVYNTKSSYYYNALYFSFGGEQKTIPDNTWNPLFTKALEYKKFSLNFLKNSNFRILIDGVPLVPSTEDEAQRQKTINRLEKEISEIERAMKFN